MNSAPPKFLVTGAGGFIASHLVEALLRRGESVRAFVRYNSRNDPGLLAMIDPELKENLEVIAGDLRDLSAVQKAVEGVTCVLHLGALIAIPYSYVHPAEVVESNILGTLNLLLASRAAGITRLVHTSTSEVYGTAQFVPIHEGHPLQGQSPYAASKIGADKLAESFYCAYQLPVVTLRPFNTYGPRQSARAVIPTIISQALQMQQAGGGVIRLGNLTATRDLTFISDTVAGFLRAAQVPGIEGQVINLGSGSEISIGNLAATILDLVDAGSDRIRIEVEPARLRPPRSEVQRLLSDNTLAGKLLGWRPVVSLENGLRQTIQWIATHPADYQAAAQGRYQV